MTHLLLLGTLLFAADQDPVYRVSVTARTAKAVNYQHRSGATKIDFRGTALMPGSRGEAKVESKQGYIEIEVEFDDLKPANTQGAEYLTYVLWAISPEGRTANLGEILLNGTKSKLNVTTELQVFGLVVTAEPYFAVTRPSDLIVMENVVRKDTIGKIEEIDAKYELLQRGQYQKMSNPLALKLDSKVPLELYEARNAVQIAKSMGAEQFASESFMKAEKSLAQAEAYQARKAGTKPVTMTAREAVQTAEDARAIAVKRQEENALAAERQQAAERETQSLNAKNAAENETDRVKREAELASSRAALEKDRLLREKDSQALASADAADRARRESNLRALEADSKLTAAKMEADSQLAAAKNEADRLRLDNEAQKVAAQAAEARALQQKTQLEADKVAMRAQLLQQFNAILTTQDTARGLIVSMPDVLFDTAKHTLRPLAREKLAKVAGIIAGHPGLRLEVEGHTDSVGTDAYNQTLSEQRSESVRLYLTEQGMASGAVTAKGMGEGSPVASNDSSSGRQQNRRVEIVVSGEMIGQNISPR
jgi:outer membrane protein OmpA-like peptidoglycan-associated protein